MTPPIRLATLTITGMRSVHCARAVWTALAGVAGVRRAEVAMGRAEVEHDGSATTEALADAVALAGYALASVEERRGGLPLL